MSTEPDRPTEPVIRIVNASLGADAQVQLVVSGVSDRAALKSAWSSSGATINSIDGRIHATTTVEALARAAGRALPRDEAMALDETLRSAVRCWLDGAPAWAELHTDVRPKIMGIVNITPDSFFDGGAVYPENHPDTGVAFVTKQIAEGADIVDIGGESTRPGAQAVTTAEELARVVPVVEAAVKRGFIVSVDTRKAEVADAAIAKGAHIINDVSGGANAKLLQTVADWGVAYVLMHTRGTPATMTAESSYGDVVAEVYEFLFTGIRRCVKAGIAADNIAVDPGIGFAKTAEQSMALLAATREFTGLGRPVLIGASRKSFFALAAGEEDPDRRGPASVAAAVMATERGAAILRVHDVAHTMSAVRTARSIRTGITTWKR